MVEPSGAVIHSERRAWEVPSVLILRYSYAVEIEFNRTSNGGSQSAFTHFVTSFVPANPEAAHWRKPDRARARSDPIAAGGTERLEHAAAAARRRYVHPPRAKASRPERLSNPNVLRRDEYTCGYCGGDALTVDHIVTRRRRRQRRRRGKCISLLCCL